MYKKEAITDYAIPAKHIDDNILINKRDKILRDTKLTTPNNIHLKNIISNKTISLDFSRLDNYLNQRELIRNSLIARNLEKMHIDKNLHSSINILAQISALRPFLPDESNLRSKNDIFDIFVNNKINRSEEFQDDAIKKARSDVELFKVNFVFI
jgi:hypothetical protein